MGTCKTAGLIETFLWVFFSHNRRITTFEHPVTGQSIMEAPTRTPPQSPLTKGSQHRKSGKSRHMKAPSASREENSKVILKGWLHKQVNNNVLIIFSLWLNFYTYLQTDFQHAFQVFIEQKYSAL